MLLIYFKEPGTTLQSFSSTVGSMRLGNSVSEPLATRDALDKYQIVAEKVVHIFYFLLVFFSCVCVVLR